MVISNNPSRSPLGVFFRSPLGVRGRLQAVALPCLPVRTIDLGFGLQAILHPPMSLHLSGGNFNPVGGEATQNAFMRWALGVPENIPLDPSGFSAQGDWALASIGDGPVHYPFYTSRPFHDTLVEQGARLGGLPRSGVWFHSEAKTLVMPHRLMNGPGPLHDQAHPLWVGLEESEHLIIPFRTEQQLYCNVDATLTLTTPTQLDLTITLLGVLRIGKTSDWTWVVSVTGNGFTCTIYNPQGSMIGTTCAAPLPSDGLWNQGCACLSDPNTQPELTKSMDMSYNNFCVAGTCGDGTGITGNEAYPGCDATHPRYMREQLLADQISQTWSRAHPTNPDGVWDVNNITEADIIEAFQPPPPPPAPKPPPAPGPGDPAPPPGDATPPFSSLGGMIAYYMRDMQWSLTQSDLLPGVSSFATIGASVVDPPKQSIQVTGQGNIPMPAVDSGACFKTVNGAPVLRRVAISNMDGMIEEIKDNFHYALTAEDLFNIGDLQNIDLAQKGLDLLGVDSPWVGGGRGAIYQYACALWKEWQHFYDTIVVPFQGNEQALINATAMDDVPLLGCVGPGGVTGFDDATGEWMFGTRQTGPVTDAPMSGGNFPYSRTDAETLRTASGTLRTPPSWGDNPNNQFNNGVRDTYRLLGQASGSSPVLIPSNVVKDCGTPNPFPASLCDNDPSNGLCLMNDDPDVWHAGSPWPKFWLYAQPDLEIRVKTTGCAIEVRGFYASVLLREQGYWLRQWLQTLFPVTAYTGWSDSRPISPEGLGGPFPGPTYVMGTLEVGRGANFSALGTLLGMSLWDRQQATPKQVMFCGQDDFGHRFRITGRGNSMDVWI